MKHIDRIKKLLRLARSSNPHEAERAMEKAMELATQHRLSIHGINPDEDPESAITHSYTDTWRSISYDKRYAAKIAEMFFNVSIIYERSNYRGDRICFIGTETNIEIARYVFSFLTRHFSYCWRNHRGRCRKRQSFVYGMYVAIFQKLYLRQGDLGRPVGTELAITHRDYIAHLFGEVASSESKRPKTTEGSFNRGFQRGLTTEIRPAIKTSKPETLRLK